MAKGKESRQYCRQHPPAPPRVLPDGVSHERANAILAGGLKWVNGTMLHYAFFAKGPWKVPEPQRAVVRAAFKEWKGARHRPRVPGGPRSLRIRGQSARAGRGASSSRSRICAAESTTWVSTVHVLAAAGQLLSQRSKREVASCAIVIVTRSGTAKGTTQVEGVGGHGFEPFASASVTVACPSPPMPSVMLTVSMIFGTMSWNGAPNDAPKMASFTSGMSHSGNVPQGGDHSKNGSPSGAAERWTVEPLSNAPTQTVPQSIPAGVLVTLPLPSTTMPSSAPENAGRIVLPGASECAGDQQRESGRPHEQRRGGGGCRHPHRLASPGDLQDIRASADDALRRFLEDRHALG
jgi:hypothetical protein